ncbi:MAG: 2-C-methyl-D-erythritol 4-phosphate cytidylyltransferase [Flavobacteriales bacterium]
MKKSVIIVAAGKGVRFGSELPKQFLPLLGWPVLMHTLRRFHEEDPATNILLVLNSSHRSLWEELQIKHDFRIPHVVIEGGEERFHSVRHAMAHVPEDTDVVAIHDGVRPMISTACIRSLFESAMYDGSAIPCMELTDSIRQWNGDQFVTALRSDFKTIQTPQCFRFNSIQTAYAQPFLPTFTDDAAVMEAAGHRLHLCAGERNNFKITTPEDFRLAEALLKHT